MINPAQKSNWVPAKEHACGDIERMITATEMTKNRDGSSSRGGFRHAAGSMKRRATMSNEDLGSAPGIRVDGGLRDNAIADGEDAFCGGPFDGFAH